MSFLYEKMDSLREFGNVKDVPSYISDNLNPDFELRKYQIQSFENYITWYESKNRPYPIQNLFHMATGSGKTLVMAGLMLYLYKQGYRNFLFFVNLSTIVKKTKDNFLNKDSSKYLFSNKIMIDGKEILIKEVSNFQYVDNNSINICFTTTQGLHSDMWFVKENSLTFDDFQDKKIAMISDEAHHLNVTTKKMNKEESENYHSWETTVRNIFNANIDNVLLEFTATCDIENPLIKAEYENKIIYDYPLYKFRSDLYSKEIKTLRCDISIMDRALQAIVLSQYRLKIFQDHKIFVKPVVLFKSAKIADSEANMEMFSDMIDKLTGSDLERISNITDNETMRIVWKYYQDNDISYEQLAQELKEDFGREHCISANDDKEAEKKQLALNSLEDKNNPYRAVFEVKKLDEGWDVLNLYDIVRMYETRDGKNGKPGKSTIAEAQLIGRGARYCPFSIDDEQDKYKRKYDMDLCNPLRTCEELYYHCQNDSRYISELNKALKEVGIDLDNVVEREYILKDDFKHDEMYLNGVIFINDRKKKTRNDVYGLLPSVKDKIYRFSILSGSSGEDTLLGDNVTLDHVTSLKTFRITFLEISKLNFNIVNKALSKNPVFRFNILKDYFPNLKSIKEFVQSKEYLGDIKIEISSLSSETDFDLLYMACEQALSEIASSISNIKEVYEGTKDFKSKYIRDIFKNKKCTFTDPHDGGVGISQNDITVPNKWKIDLSTEEWFAFTDNYGTSEEKSFVAYFKKIVEQLKMNYTKVYLIRNERQFHLYSFDGGERFEPDYVLMLQKEKSIGYSQLQVFIEPKGSHLLEKDKWKEEFLLSLKSESIPVIEFVDDNDYKIWGFHFYNYENNDSVFIEDMDSLLM